MSLPPELKPLKRFVREAKKSQKVSPLIAYYCRLYAIQEAMKLDESKKTGATKQWLNGQLTLLEECRTDTPRDQAQGEILNMANNVFKHADEVDRAGNASKQTAAAFNSAFVFYEILKQFGEREADIVSRAKYCMFKTMDILRALKEGRKPKPGPPGDDGENDELNDEFNAINADDGNNNNDPNQMEGPPAYDNGGGGSGNNSMSPQNPSPNSNQNPYNSPPAQPQQPSNNNSQNPNANPYQNNQQNNNPYQNNQNNGQNQHQHQNRNRNPNGNQYPNNNNNQQPQRQPQRQPQPNQNPNQNPYRQNNSGGQQPSHPVNHGAHMINVGQQHTYQKQMRLPHFEQKIQACVEAERMLKEAMGALRFEDCDTAIKKAEEAIAIMQPHR